MGLDVLHHGSGYIGYMHWREAVARAAGYPAVDNAELRHAPHLTGAWESTDGPLWELLCFSDCEGTIGPVVSAKLAADFETHAHLRDALDERHHGWWDFFARAFKATADGGAMRFS
jgi:hypothetical protein